MTPYNETHQNGYLSVEMDIPVGTEICDFGIQIAKDGRVWVCIDGVAFLRFRPKIRKEVKRNEL